METHERAWRLLPSPMRAVLGPWLAALATPSPAAPRVGALVRGVEAASEPIRAAAAHAGGRQAGTVSTAAAGQRAHAQASSSGRMTTTAAR